MQKTDLGRRWWALVVVVVGLATPGGCGGGGDGVTRCVRDEALLAVRHECALDEDCPCGAHCALGLCTTDCAANTDCGGGQQCNDFGRCSQPGVSGLTQALPTTPRARLSFDRTMISMQAPGSAQKVWVRATGHDSGPIRFAARGPLEVRCRAGEDFAADCSLDNLPAGDPAPQPIEIRRVPAAETDATGVSAAVDVHTADGARTTLGVLLRQESPPIAVRPEGVYRGFAQPVGAGLKSRNTPTELPPQIREIQIPVTIKVFGVEGTTRVVALADELGAVFPAPQAVGSLAIDSSSRWQLDLPRQRFLGPEAPAAADLEISVAGNSVENGVTWNGEMIAVVLETRYGGATLERHDPYVRWRIAAHWVEALSEPVPTATPFIPIDVPSRAEVPLAVEGAVLALLPPDVTAQPTAAQRSAATICTPAGYGQALGLAGAIVQFGGVDAATGDLACADVALSPQPTLGVLSRSLLAVDEVVDQCVTDVGRLHDDQAALQTAGCADATRLLTALSLALAVDRDRALGKQAGAEPAASALAHRLLQQWLGLAGWLGREAREVQRLNGILAAADRLPQASSTAAVLQSGVDAMDLVLHPRVAVALPVLPPSVLQAPDYRPLLFPAATYPTGVRSHDQDVGLPVALLAMLRQQLAVLGGLTEDARFQRTTLASFRPTLTSFARRAFVVLGLAYGLYANARTLGAPPWQQEWEVAGADLGSAFRGVLAALHDLEAGKNPLGIEDIDLPLYRIGDEGTALERFAALTDYLLGTPGDTREAIAPFLVRRAQEQLDVAREAWRRNAERDFQAQLITSESERRIEGINRRYGERIISLCGDPTWTSDTVLRDWDTIDASDCFLADAPECHLSEADLRARLTTADVGYRLCFAFQLRQRLGPNVTTDDPNLDAVIDSLGPYLIDENGAYDVRLVDEGDRGFFTCAGETDNCAFMTCNNVACQRFLAVRLPEGAPPAFLDEARQTCGAASAATEAKRPSLPPASCRVTDHCPVGYVCSSGTCMPDPSVDVAAEHPECFRGALGVQAVALQSTAREVDIARSELAELSERYDVAMKSCLITKLGHEAQESALHAHNETMHSLGAAKLAADVVANVAGAAKDCADSDNVLSFGGKGVAATVEAAAKSVSDGLQFAMDEAERKHAELMLRIQDETQEQVCFNDAEMHLVGTRTAALRIQQASLGLARELVEFENLKAELRGLLVEGHAAVENEVGRRVSPLATDFWLDEGVERYHDYLRQARRATYLAVLSAEYEFQLSSAERAATLAAQTPAELQRVVDNLRARTATGTVGGASPANLLAVVSLRQHLLQLADRSAIGPGWHALSPTERFRSWLTAPRNARYDHAGNYLGQEIRFAMMPLGASGLGETGGIPLLTGNDCAERLWLVNASLVGHTLLPGSDSTFSRVVLRKRNTFFSQWCTPPADGATFQAASTRPSRNLFLDPYSYVESLTPATPQPSAETTDESQGFSDARISAYVNVARGEFERGDYDNGASQELAGRGLYGEYAIFFPAETLSRNESVGLDLGALDDILLRFDYVSVAR